jgi:hypothetical protein
MADNMKRRVEAMWTTAIGQNAGVLWKLLNTKGPQNITNLKKLSRVDEKQLYLALGWLAREDKVKFIQDKRAVLVSLK